MLRLFMNGIPRDAWKYWGKNSKDCMRNIIMLYYNRNIVRRVILLVAVVIPVLIMYRYNSDLIKVLTVVWYTGILEFILRRIDICSMF